MLDLDQVARFLYAENVQSLIVKTGEFIRYVDAGGQSTALENSVDEKQVGEFIDSHVPPDVRKAWDATGWALFRYSTPNGDITIELMREENHTCVTIRPAAPVSEAAPGAVAQESEPKADAPSKTPQSALLTKPRAIPFQFAEAPTGAPEKPETPADDAASHVHEGNEGNDPEAAVHPVAPVRAAGAAYVVVPEDVPPSANSAVAAHVAPQPPRAYAPRPVVPPASAFTAPRPPAPPEEPQDIRVLRSSIPKHVPFILLRTDTQLNRSAGMTGMALGLLFSGAAVGAAAAFCQPTDIFAKLFDWKNPTTLIPVSIFCMFIWGLVICWQRASRLKRLLPLCDVSFLGKINAAMRSTGVEATAQVFGLKANADSELIEPASITTLAVSPLLRRIRASFEQWQLSSNRTDVDLVLQQHVINDDESVQSGYSLVRTFVWALPVLGLIGTVIGISLAVGDFAQFLASGTNDMKEIKQHLAGVTTGLAFAFLITLSGLLTSLVLMLIASSQQTREQRAFSDFHQEIVDLFLPELQRTTSHSDEGKKQDSESQLNAANANLLAHTDETFQRVFDGIEERHLMLTQRFEDWSRAQNQHFAESGSMVLAAVKKTCDQVLLSVDKRLQSHFQRFEELSIEQNQRIANTGVQLLQALQETCDKVLNAADGRQQNQQAQLTAWTQTMEDLKGSFHAAANQHVEGMASTASGLINSTSEQSNLLRANGAALASVTQTTAALQATQSQLEQALDKAAANLSAAVSRAENAILNGSQVANRQSQAAMEDVRRLTQSIDGLLHLTHQLNDSHKTLHDATRQLHDSQLGGTLTSLRDSLTTLAPVLDHFRRPHVLQFAPMPMPPHDGNSK